MIVSIEGDQQNVMGRSDALSVLVCEDNEDDYELLVRELRRSGRRVDAVRVQSAAELRAAIASRPIDIVFADWAMPSFVAPEALEILRASDLDVPFIIVSGTLGEDAAVEALRNGAHDFLVKARLARLGVIVDRELREAASRRERARMQEQLMISDRMASVGVLAAGVAHEINNPLAAVLANLDLALDDIAQVAAPELRAVLEEELRDARTAADRVRNIVRDLRIFSRTEDERSGPVDVRKVMESTLRMASNEVRHRARIVREYEDVPPVQGSEARLGQVFLNLIVNAAQAIPEGRFEANEIRVAISAAGESAKITVTDTGPGLSTDAAKHLFEPFYTTKPAALGTGLGLSICHRIVTALGGRITADNAPGAGARFTVVLPFAGAELEDHETQPLPLVRATRRGRVLIVDDEPMLARAVQRAIGDVHEVTAVSRGADALLLIASGARFDVVVSDLMMPEMSGMELYAEVQQIAAAQARAFIFLTGGAFTPGAQSFLDSVENLRIEKPFDPAQLRAVINDRIR